MSSYATGVPSTTQLVPYIVGNSCASQFTSAIHFNHLLLTASCAEVELGGHRSLRMGVAVARGLVTAALWLNVTVDGGRLTGIVRLVLVLPPLLIVRLKELLV